MVGAVQVKSWSLGGVLAVVLAGAMAAPAQANQWIVYTGGDRPNREFVVVDEDFINPGFNTDDAFKVEAAIIYEGASKPDWMTANYYVDCSRKTIRSELVQISPRNGALKRGPDVPEHKISSITENQILVFGCDKGKKSAAQRARERDANNDSRNFIYMGPYGLPKIVDIVWDKLWTDGKRPAYSSNVSIAEQNRQVEEIMRKKNETVAAAGQIAAQSQKDADALQDSQKRRKARMKREKYIVRAMEDWIGRTERELVSSWGQPASVETHGDFRVLNYQKSYTETNKVMATAKGDFVTQDTVFSCTMSMAFRNGKLDDYMSAGGLACERLYGPR